MSALDPHNVEHVRRTLDQLCESVREMTYGFSKSIPRNPTHANLLARPQNDRSMGPPCRICGLPGHQSNNISSAAACRPAILSLVSFWEVTAEQIKFLYRGSKQFETAVRDNKPAYEMRFDDAPLVGGSMGVVVVNHLTRNYLKFLRHMARILAKATVILQAADWKRYDAVSAALNDFLLGGLTLSDLFERSLAGKTDKNGDVFMT